MMVVCQFTSISLLLHPAERRQQQQVVMGWLGVAIFHEVCGSLQGVLVTERDACDPERWSLSTD